jgi:hypothetical protein
MNAIKLAVLSLLVYSSLSFAGGSIGGGGGSISLESALELANVTSNIEALPKTYMDGDDFRRVRARLSVSGVQTVPALIDGESLDLKAFKDSVVDVEFSKEFLPSVLKLNDSK